MATGGSVAAVDLGATSGRVILGRVAGHDLRLTHIARFPNHPVELPERDGAEGLHWDVLGLWAALRDGLAAAAHAEPELASVGVDSWAVDYGLLRQGRLVGLPYHYRDGRVERTHQSADGVGNSGNGTLGGLSEADLYAKTGIANLPFNTVFQLAADRDAGTLEFADRALLMPDLIGRWLTGVEATERTNASTTGMLSPVTGAWDADILAAAGVGGDLFAPFVSPGQTVGPILRPLASRFALDHDVPVTAVGSHDTASAVVGAPLVDENAAYISSGTWSLVGLELDRAIVSEGARIAGFTNEGGVDGRIRFLKNISGLWLLSESMRVWQAEDDRDSVAGAGAGAGETRSDLAALLASAASVPSQAVPVFDASDDVFTAPADMPSRIAGWCTGHGLRPPASRAEFVRSILESLAAAYASALDEAVRLTGRTVSAVHVVGGGSRNELLCQLTADRTGLPVLAGPVEATAIGNVLVQARAVGLVARDSSLEALRALVRSAYPPRRYDPASVARSAAAVARKPAP